MPGLITDEDAELIGRASIGLPEGSVVLDLGAGQGGTALAVLSANPTVRVVSVDKDAGGLAGAREKAERVGAADRWEGLEMSSLDAHERFEHGSLALVLLDTSHEYEQTVKEIEVWLPKIRLGGYFWFHDYDAINAPNPPLCFYPGVKKAVDPLITRGLLRAVERHGWSLLTQVVAHERVEDDEVLA